MTRYNLMTSIAVRIIAVTIIVLFAAPAGFGADPTTVRAMEKGLAAAKIKDYALAIRYFQEARRTSPYAPEILYNIGLAESRMQGRQFSAMTWFKAFLAASPNSPKVAQVRSLYKEMEVSTESDVRKLINLRRDVASRLPENERSTALWIVAGYQARTGEFVTAAQTASGSGIRRGIAFRDIADYQAQSGDFSGALRSASMAEEARGCAYSAVARQQAGKGTVSGARQALELARANGGCPNNPADSAIIKAQARQGDSLAALKTVEGMPERDRNLYYQIIAGVQAKRGDIKGAQRTVKLMKYAQKWVYTDIAECQARQGDVKGALKTAELARDQEDDMPVRVSGSFSAKEYAYRKIACVQALKGDFAGARKTAALITNASEKDATTRSLDIVAALWPTRNSGNLPERVVVLTRFEGIIDTLNSPDYPWFANLSGYLKSLISLTEPNKIEWGVDKALMGELAIGEMDARKGGILNTFEKIRDLDKTQE
jgi:tetratricopeptide (TPR) repeat protein